MTTKVIVKVSEQMKQHLDLYAGARNMTLSELMRQIAAKATAYDLEGDNAIDGRGRPTKYTSDAQRLEARRERARATAEHRRKVVAALRKSERIEGADALEAYLESHGVVIDDA